MKVECFEWKAGYVNRQKTCFYVALSCPLLLLIERGVSGFSSQPHISVHSPLHVHAGQKSSFAFQSRKPNAEESLE